LFKNVKISVVTWYFKRIIFNILQNKPAKKKLARNV